MGFLNSILDALADRLESKVYNYIPSQSVRDYKNKRKGYSVEAEISEALADLMLMLSSMPISGDSERAKWLDNLSDKFFRLKAKSLVSSAFGSGDALVVPSWNGRNIQNLIVDSENFIILDTSGDEIISCAYIVDQKYENDQQYTLLQAVELVPYESGSQTLFANRYRMFATVGDSFTEVPLSRFADWSNRFEKEWIIPNVDRLLIARYKSSTIDTENLNTVKGVPICYGASGPIEEIHYLLDQMHVEFGMSEKAIIADKRMFQKSIRNGAIVEDTPHGKDRLFVKVQGASNDMQFNEWSPEIRYQAYLDALDKQERLVERAVGVSGGIISSGNDINYQNVDNVRKSQQKTMSFISTARETAEECMHDLVYAWNVLANYYDINPMGAYDINFDWSNEFIETFADRQNAILAGIPFNATDAVDYRMFVMEESPETARERVAEIEAKQSDNIYIEDVMVDE